MHVHAQKHTMYIARIIALNIALYCLCVKLGKGKEGVVRKGGDMRRRERKVDGNRVSIVKGFRL